MMDEWLRKAFALTYYFIGTIYYLLGVVITLAGATWILDLQVAVDPQMLASGILFLFGGVVISVALYQVQYEFTLFKRIAQKEKAIGELVEHYLFHRMRSDYREQVLDPPEIRISILLKHKDNKFEFPPKLLGESYLQIAYTSGDFSIEELNTAWKKNQGAIGTAWAKDQAVWVDRQYTRDPPELGLTAEQNAATTHIGSVLSIPIYSLESRPRDNPIGILNIDSEAGLEESRFDEAEVRAAFIEHAKMISALL